MGEGGGGVYKIEILLRGFPSTKDKKVRKIFKIFFSNFCPILCKTFQRNNLVHSKIYKTKFNRLIFIFKELLDRWLSIMFHILKIILLILYLDGQITTVSVSAPILSKKAAAASPKSLSTQKCVSNQWKGVTELNPIQADVWLTQNSLGGGGG